MPPPALLPQVINNDKLNIQTGLTCPVKDCVSLCDLVVMQVGGWGGVPPCAVVTSACHVRLPSVKTETVHSAAELTTPIHLARTSSHRTW